MRKPDFIIAGTQKAGTTWLRHNLFLRADVDGANNQIHYFDRHYGKGISWYCSHFSNLPSTSLVGEKSTEYFDPTTVDMVAARIAKDCPDTKIIVVLREPIARALSAVKHTVVSGHEPLPKDPDSLLFIDRTRPVATSHRYIERGFYASQLESLLRHIPKERLLVLIFEEDIVANPKAGLERALRFLGADCTNVQPSATAINARRLSVPAIRMMHTFRNVPFARSLVWRVDQYLNFKRWQPQFARRTLQALGEIYAPENEALYNLLGRPIQAWQYP